MDFRKGRRPRVPRWLVVALTITGATLMAPALQSFLAADDSVVLNDKQLGPSTASPGVPTPETPTTISLDGRDLEAGECVTWNPRITEGRLEGRTTKVVPCDQPHLIEIAGSVIFADHISDPYPTEADWDAFYERECQPLAEARIFRGPIDPQGRFHVGGIGPTVEGWAAGDRRVWCGASATEGTAPPPDVDGPYVLFTGKVAGQSQTLVDPPGTCRAAEADWPVPCDQVHSWEVTGTADVSGKVNGPPASGDSKGWDRLVGADCKRLGTAYLGHPPTGDVSAGWIAIEAGSWAAGRRLVECVVARYQNDTAVPMTGSLKG